MGEHLRQESMEECAEKILDDMTEGLPEGKFRCFCGEVEKLDNAVPSTPSPYSPPMCLKCAMRAPGDRV